MSSHILLLAMFMTPILGMVLLAYLQGREKKREAKETKTSEPRKPRRFR